MRIGLGEDTHRLTDGGPLRLGGITIPHYQSAVGHSDADALLHAVTDALLGAAGLPDIGELFPDTDNVNKDRDSAELLRQAYELVQKEGFSLVNLDCVVLAQNPKLSPHKRAICQRIAEILQVHASCVNLKAKTGEGVGPVGLEQIIQTRCIVMLKQE